MTKKSSGAFDADADWAADLRPTRWVARPAGIEAPEDRLAALMRAGVRAEGLSGAGWARVLSRLSMPAASFRWRRPIGLRWAIVVVMLLMSGAVIGAVSAHRWWPAAPAVEEVPAARRSTDKPRSARRTRPARGATELLAPGSPALTAPAEAPAEVPASTAPVGAPARIPVSTAPVGAPARTPVSTARVAPARALASTASTTSAAGHEVSRPRGRNNPAPGPPSTDIALAPAPAAAPPPVIEVSPAIVPPPVVVTAPPVTGLSVEARLLGYAVAQLRQQRDATDALLVLDQYRRQFPEGTLRREAEVARVDALLMLGRERDALGVLQTLRLQSPGRDQELRVIRGELAAATDCAGAVADFDRVLSQMAPAALIERALFGRAVCRARQGDATGSTRDLGEYLTRFPTGRFAAEARRSLRENNL